MTFADDLLSDIDDVFTDPEEFGVAAVFTHGLVQTTVNVQFFNEFVMSIILGIEAANLSPEVRGKASDFPAITKKSDTLTINSIAYKITGIEPDGSGMVRLKLSRD